ncbi:MAG: bifunctional nuclease family protein [Candidatus Omnitrophota bacterium]
MKKASIFSLIMVKEAGQYLVTLEEAVGMRLIPIWIGPAEGVSIAAALQKQSFPRPLTHDLFISMLKEMEVKIEKIIITDLKHDTFYANIVLRKNGKSYVIDSRPSDSIAIAVRAQAPIFIEEEVFNKCPEILKPITEKEVDRFKKVLENLRPEDFFKEKRDG